MVEYSVAIIDDEESIRRGVTLGLKKDYTVMSFPTAELALEKMEHVQPDLVLLDIGLPGMNGLEALVKIKAIDPEILVIMITAYEEIETVISAMKQGAYDYIIKPLHMDSIRKRVNNALETIQLRKEIQALREDHIRENMPCIVGESDAIQDVIQFVEKFGKSPDTPILITGESGTGKELIARAVHNKSPNFRGPFVALNCASIPKELIESELFGYEKGAFSGAAPGGKKGLIEQAAEGTLFLDEIGDMSLEAQAKLLRFMEDGRYFRLGGTKEQHAKVRVVSATNRDIQELIDENLFRLDLYYRIGVIKIEVPSLSERKGDIIPMARYFLSEFNQKFKKTFTDIEPDARKALINHRWAGNVRELRNLIERGVLIGTGQELKLEDLGIVNTGPGETGVELALGSKFPDLPRDGIDLEALEKHFLKAAVKRSEGNDKKAAELLGMSYYTFRYRKKKLDES